MFPLVWFITKYLKGEDNFITRLRSQTPEESVALIGPHNAVVFVVFDGGLWKGMMRLQPFMTSGAHYNISSNITNDCRGILVGYKELHSSKLPVFQLLNFALRERKHWDWIGVNYMEINILLNIPLASGQ